MKIHIRKTAKVYSRKVRECLTAEQLLRVIDELNSVDNLVSGRNLMDEAILETTKKPWSHFELEALKERISKIESLAHQNNYNPHHCYPWTI